MIQSVPTVVVTGAALNRSATGLRSPILSKYRTPVLLAVWQASPSGQSSGMMRRSSIASPNTAKASPSSADRTKDRDELLAEPEDALPSTAEHNGAGSARCWRAASPNNAGYCFALEYVSCFPLRSCQSWGA